MKAIFTFFLVLFIGVTAQAQNQATEVKVETIVMTIVNATEKQEVTFKSNKDVARLYRFKNSKVTKELSFTTRLNKAKLA